jgi:bifunctional UDP-N-acetylglucosamine pyrophosphorylase/glucosamine-1-phosphate N-acetyltransferase
MQVPASLSHMPYGRLVLSNGKFERIVEGSSITSVGEGCIVANSGAYKIKTDLLRKYLPSLRPDKNSGELFFTDVLNLAKTDGVEIEIIQSSDYWSFHGVNTKEDLVEAEKIMQKRLREEFLNRGVVMQDPNSVFFSFDTELSPGVEIEPFVVLRPGVKIGSGSVIHSFSYLEDCCIQKRSSVGPFARIRGNSDIGTDVCIGNFVEVKGSKISSGTKAKHLSYLGDSEIGTNANIGAGVITCNFDGEKKHKTAIGNNAMIGANVSLVAPLIIGENSKIGAGSTITENVQDETLALTRPPQVTVPIKKRERTIIKRKDQRSTS